jgi:hypothetical protein
MLRWSPRLPRSVGWAAIGRCFVLALAWTAATPLCCVGSSPLTYTRYDTCLPPCIEQPLVACIGAATSCQGQSLLTCWDSGAHEETDSSSLGIGGAATTDASSSFYAPDGSLCAREDVSTVNGVRQSSLSDANGMFIGSLAYVASSGYVWTCGGKQYLENGRQPGLHRRPRGFVGNEPGLLRADRAKLPLARMVRQNGAWSEL